jgi:hypothetical protein
VCVVEGGRTTSGAQVQPAGISQYPDSSSEQGLLPLPKRIVEGIHNSA